MTLDPESRSHLVTVPLSVGELLHVSKDDFNDSPDVSRVIIAARAGNQIDVGMAALSEVGLIVPNDKEALNEEQFLSLTQQSSETDSKELGERASKVTSLEQALLRRCFARKALVAAGRVYENDFTKIGTTVDDNPVRIDDQDLVEQLFDNTVRFDNHPLLLLIAKAVLAPETRSDDHARTNISLADRYLRLMFLNQVNVVSIPMTHTH